MIKPKNTNRGLIKLVIIIIVILLVLAYFGLNLRSIVSSPTFQDNWTFIKGIAVYIWDHFLKIPLTFILQKIVGASTNS